MSTHEGIKEDISSLVFEVDAANIKSNSPNRFFAYGNSGYGSSADNDVTFLINGSGIFKRLGYGQIFGDYTITQSDVVYKYNLGLSGCHYHGNTVYIPQGAYIAYKYDYYISPDAQYYGESGNNFYLSNAENNGAGVGTETYASNSVKGTWQTVSGNFGPATTSGNVNFYLYPGACSPDARIARLASSGYILYKNPQVEVVYSSTATVSTSFTYNHASYALKDTSNSGVNATMFGTAPYEVDIVPCFNFATVTSSYGSGNLAIGALMGFTLSSNPVPVNGNFTISVWIKNPNSSGQVGLFANAGGSDGYRFGVADTSMYYLIGSSSGVYKESYISYPTLSSSIWNNIVAVYDKTNKLISCYVNGIFTGSDSIPDLTNLPFTPIAPGIVRSGCCSLFTGKLSNLSVYNTALPATTILSNFQANRSRYAV